MSEPVFTKDGIALPPLPWSDKPEHILGQRACDEEQQRVRSIMIRMANHFGVSAICSNPKCARRKSCSGWEVARSGRLAGLLTDFPECFYEFREEFHVQCQEVAAELRQKGFS